MLIPFTTNETGPTAGTEKDEGMDVWVAVGTVGSPRPAQPLDRSSRGPTAQQSVPLSGSAILTSGATR